jgi:hypothetical protein
MSKLHITFWLLVAAPILGYMVYHAGFERGANIGYQAGAHERYAYDCLGKEMALDWHTYEVYHH